MMTRTNRRAEEFDRALSAGKATDPGTAALVALAGALAAVPQRPAPAFRESLRATLVSEATKIAAAGSAVSVAAGAAPAMPAATGLKGLTQILSKPAMQVVTGGLAATIAATGVGVGASRSLPGDTLYGLKRTVENLQNALAGGTVAKVDSVVEHAQTRIDEIEALLDRDGLSALGDVEDALNDLKADLDDATTDLLAQARAGSQAAYDKLAETVRTLTAELQGLRSSLPAEAQDELAAALGTLNSAAAQLSALPRPVGPTESPSPVKTTPPTSTSPTSSQSGSPSTSPSGGPTATVPTITTPPPPSTTLPTDLPTVTVPPLPQFP